MQTDGLADADTAAKGDEASGGTGAKMFKARQTVDSSFAILDLGGEDITPLQLWSMALEKYKTLERCEETLEHPNSSEEPKKIQAMKDESWAIRDAVLALHKLASREIREQLHAFVQQAETGHVNIKVGHRPELLNSFSADYWTHTLSHLFYRDDCRESYPCHGRRQLRGRRWGKVLLKRVDFRGWALSKESAAMLANIDLRRRQMWGVHRHVVLNNGHARDIDDILSIAPVDF